MENPDIDRPAVHIGFPFFAALFVASFFGAPFAAVSAVLLFAAVFLLFLILCGCSTPTSPDTIVMPQTSAETRTEPAPVSAEPEPGVFHPEYEQTSLPQPHSRCLQLQ